ncbi:hypothetical protein QVD17_01773 [Tagetes erecta]|uniref:Uncharacterized protein n=1 Tax=Tagetes erecta TaxID=13708 RepID=A0AAD8L833_TARER|nr:hypothetical protein QVD17_01773 [Tagetes erecta]
MHRDQFSVSTDELISRSRAPKESVEMELKSLECAYVHVHALRFSLVLKKAVNFPMAGVCRQLSCCRRADCNHEEGSTNGLVDLTSHHHTPNSIQSKSKRKVYTAPRIIILGLQIISHNSNSCSYPQIEHPTHRLKSTSCGLWLGGISHLHLHFRPSIICRLPYGSLERF